MGGGVSHTYAAFTTVERKLPFVVLDLHKPTLFPLPLLEVDILQKACLFEIQVAQDCRGILLELVTSMYGFPFPQKLQHYLVFTV